MNDGPPFWRKLRRADLLSAGVCGLLLLAVGLIVLAALAAFSSSFVGDFVFDDEASIVNNPTIRQLWPIGKPLCPPNRGETVSGRPVLNLSLALNYAASGYDVCGYHATNLAIHIFAALLLFGIIRRTLLMPAMRDTWGAAAVPLALAIALLWAIHPLQTESVTYIVQRAESLAGLFYLLTLYCFIRGVSSGSPLPLGEGPGVRAAGDTGPNTFAVLHDRPHPSPLPKGEETIWYAASALACLLGMASKEAMVSAPLVVLLYDRTFCAGSFREAWRRRYGFYLALAGTWLLLGWLVVSTGNLGRSAGPEAQRFTAWSYLLTQPGVIVHYLRLVVWPSELCLDYGWPAAVAAREIIVPAIFLIGLLALTVWALVKRPAWGLLGVWFFATLAPSSSFLPLGQAAFEHRMYLPLAAVLAALVAAGWMAGKRLVDRGAIPLQTAQVLGGAFVLLAAVAFGLLSFERNFDYRSDLSIWEDTVAKAPRNPRAHSSLGAALARRQLPGEATSQYQKALEINPDDAVARNNLGVILAEEGDFQQAISHFRKALESVPNYEVGHNNLGLALSASGRPEEAIAQYRKAIEINPDYPQAHNHLGLALAARGELDEAILHFRKAVELDPDYADARTNLGVALRQRERN